MLSIGQFSKICQVSTKTLRYYAEIGLLDPNEINPENGYRYYSIEQLKEMLLINRLKSYDLSLEEIKIILQSGDMWEDRLCTALERKKKVMKDQIRLFEEKLEQIELDISLMREGSSIMSYLESIDVKLVEAQPMCLLSVRKVVTREECAKGYGQFFYPLFDRIAERNLTVTAPPVTIYHSTEFNPAGYDIEFAVPVREISTGTRDFIPGLCLKTVLKGPYSEVTSVYAKQMEWAEKEGYVCANPPYDSYVTNPLEVTSPEMLVTEIYYPVKKIKHKSKNQEV